VDSYGRGLVFHEEGRPAHFTCGQEVVVFKRADTAGISHRNDKTR
jgi:hypothetical protein